MKGRGRLFTERNFVVVLFVLVMITFSLASRDSKKLDKLYTSKTEQKAKLAEAKKDSGVTFNK